MWGVMGSGTVGCYGEWYCGVLWGVMWGVMGSGIVGCFHLACEVQYSAVLELEAQ